jgi:hypothetical protein
MTFVFPFDIAGSFHRMLDVAAFNLLEDKVHDRVYRDGSRHLQQME